MLSEFPHSSKARSVLQDKQTLLNSRIIELK